jgi:hypothetical protein
MPESTCARSPTASGPGPAAAGWEAVFCIACAIVEIGIRTVQQGWGTITWFTLYKVLLYGIDLSFKKKYGIDLVGYSIQTRQPCAWLGHGSHQSIGFTWSARTRHKRLVEGNETTDETIRTDQTAETLLPLLLDIDRYRYRYRYRLIHGNATNIWEYFFVYCQVSNTINLSHLNWFIGTFHILYLFVATASFLFWHNTMSCSNCRVKYSTLKWINPYYSKLSSHFLNCLPIASPIEINNYGFSFEIEIYYR